jgi:ABC-type Fe3+-siderophore transport system permease subunit
VFFFAVDADWEEDWQIPTTTLAVSVYSFLALGAAALVDRRQVSILGRGGVAVSLLAGALALVLIWFDGADENDSLVNVWAVATVGAVVGAHVCLLLARARDDDSDAIRTILLGTVAVSAVLGTLVSLAIVRDWDDDGWWRVLGSLAVLAALGTALVPILRKLQD